MPLNGPPSNLSLANLNIDFALSELISAKCNLKTMPINVT